MTVNGILKLDGFEAVTVTDGDREIKGGYIGDLLSWVMGRAQADNAWITIMTNINIVAVASLTDVSCIILAEGVRPDAAVTETAASKNVNILVSEKSAYETAVLLGQVI